MPGGSEAVRTIRLVQRSVDIRRELVVAASADEVWAVVAAPERQAEWFPGMVTSEVDGTQRTVVTAAGGFLTEEILGVDHDRRCFEYRITGPFHIDHHLGRITVVPAGDGCRVVYEQEMSPKALVPVLNAALGDALEGLRDLVVHGRTSRAWEAPVPAPGGDAA